MTEKAAPKPRGLSRRKERPLASVSVYPGKDGGPVLHVQIDTRRIKEAALQKIEAAGRGILGEVLEGLFDNRKGK